ncbi:NADH:flavin oxidoreductase/NADH oxidase [Pseudacidovorax intermedius]|uniref:NADH:flavin oxidoreductase / NADH oxidase n=1 Tax=Pseudacidovorax intermedius TaxID=433924 RepID=A0A147GQH1_9BURK|nr:NADH:flavin oxidoreductase/NADH oxidase [Pseudacidovorax intermedius]KTT17496.1 NADH:flavin oxidoreductase / NADH oxidase [Pseudacidovorax intermedius]
MDTSADTPGASQPRLFQPLQLRGLTLANRVVISPMCQHAARDGQAGPWHLVHLGKFALGGAGLILTESTAVDPRGRIGTADLGLWSDSQVAPLQAVVDFVHDNGAAIGVQLAHAGRKAGSQPLWEGGAALSDAQMQADSLPWARLGASPLAAGPGWSAPAAMDAAQIEAAIDAFVQAAVRADRAGFDVAELHFGHGYLVASFLSPHANQRQDAWGGSLQGRMKLALDIAGRVRAVWPAAKPLFCRLSAVDGSVGGWGLEDSVVLARALAERGVDVIDCSSGGLTEETKALPVPRGLGFQVPFAARIREAAGVKTQAVGMIVDAHQAESVLREGQADLIALGREALWDPYWAHHAAQALGADPQFRHWPVRHGVWLAKRAPSLARARDEAGRTGTPLPAG